MALKLGRIFIHVSFNEPFQAQYAERYLNEIENTLNETFAS